MLYLVLGLISAFYCFCHRNEQNRLFDFSVFQMSLQHRNRPESQYYVHSAPINAVTSVDMSIAFPEGQFEAAFGADFGMSTANTSAMAQQFSESADLSFGTSAGLGFAQSADPLGADGQNYATMSTDEDVEQQTQFSEGTNVGFDYPLSPQTYAPASPSLAMAEAEQQTVQSDVDYSLYAPLPQPLPLPLCESTALPTVKVEQSDSGSQMSCAGTQLSADASTSQQRRRTQAELLAADIAQRTQPTQRRSKKRQRVAKGLRANTISLFVFQQFVLCVFSGAACLPCRQRRIKCDGSRPCARCIKENRVDQCADQISTAIAVATSALQTQTHAQIQTQIRAQARTYAASLPSPVPPCVVVDRAEAGMM